MMAFVIQNCMYVDSIYYNSYSRKFIAGPRDGIIDSRARSNTTATTQDNLTTVLLYDLVLTPEMLNTLYTCLPNLQVILCIYYDWQTTTFNEDINDEEISFNDYNTICLAEFTKLEEFYLDIEKLLYDGYAGALLQLEYVNEPAYYYSIEILGTANYECNIVTSTADAITRHRTMNPDLTFKTLIIQCNNKETKVFFSSHNRNKIHATFSHGQLQLPSAATFIPPYYFINGNHVQRYYYN